MKVTQYRGYDLEVNEDGLWYITQKGRLAISEKFKTIDAAKKYVKQHLGFKNVEVLYASYDKMRETEITSIAPQKRYQGHEDYVPRYKTGASASATTTGSWGSFYEKTEYNMKIFAEVESRDY